MFKTKFYYQPEAKEQKNSIFKKCFKALNKVIYNADSFRLGQVSQYHYHKPVIMEKVRATDIELERALKNKGFFIKKGFKIYAKAVPNTKRVCRNYKMIDREKGYRSLAQQVEPGSDAGISSCKQDQIDDVALNILF